MSERIEIEICDNGAVICHAPDGGFSIVQGDSHWRVIAAIRQQQADIEQLRVKAGAYNAVCDVIDRADAMAGDGIVTSIQSLLNERDKLRAELAEIKQEVSQAGYLGGPSLSACVNAMAGHLRELKDELAAIKAAPTEAYMMLVVGRDNDYTKYVRLMPYDGPQLELIARPK